MKTAATKGWAVEANGTRSVAMTKAQAERVAKALREGKTDLRRKAHAAPVEATVVAV